MPEVRRHRQYWLLGCLGALTLVTVLIVLSTPVVVEHWDSRVLTRVQGQFVDSTSGSPLPGLTLLILQDIRDADDEERIRSRRFEALRWFEEAGFHDAHIPRLDDDTFKIAGYVGNTDAEGRFDLCSRASFGGTDRTWGGFSRPDTPPPPYWGVAGLLVEWPDGRRLVLDTTTSTYTVVDGADFYAVIDMCVVEVDPADAKLLR